MRTRWALVGLGLMAAAIWTGCAPRGGGGNTNGNAANDNDNVSDGELTAEQQLAVETATVMLNDMAETLGSLSATANPENYTAEGLGECPVVTATREGSVTTLSLDFGDGCTNAATGETVYSGNVTVIVDVEALTFVVAFADFTVDGQSVNGSISATLVSLPRDETPLAFQGDVELTTQNGSLSGTLFVTIDTDTGVITITEGQLTMGDAEGNAYSVTLTSVVLDPVNNGNFIPEGGTASFELATGIGDTTVTVTITFTEETPTTGVVLVTVGDSEPVEYTLSFFEEG